ncbi:hypothetical protein SDC9_148216 [bioreactor metagenome]|uniref:Holin family protein n=1 Tax=bioreactor metagenome TaxID=1076179 RepID=A0A645EGZ3_9ZZZZ
MEHAGTIKNGVLAFLAGVGSLIANQLGGVDETLKLLLGCITVDYITGWIVAAVFQRSDKSAGGGLDSKAGFKGLCRKCAILLFVWLATLLDEAVGASYTRTAVCLFFAANEGLSILENLGIMGIPYPEFIKNALEALKKKGEQGTGGDIS